jgi:hypothetical protein
MGQEHNINEHQKMRAGDLADFTKFYPSDALFNQIENDSYSGQSPESIVESIRRERISSSKKPTSSGSSLYRDISNNGVLKPVAVSRTGTSQGFHIDEIEEETGIRPSMGIIEDGHHRIYSAADIDPDMEVPIRWVH